MAVTGTSPLISVVIPFYKGEKYIEQCINSVLMQPFYDIEVILVNDGSPINSDLCHHYNQEDICKSIASCDSRIRYYKKDNEGIGATRNFGISKACGQYIACLDQDDCWVRDFLTETIITQLDGETDILSFDVYNCNENLYRASLESKPSGIIRGGYEATIKGSFHHSIMNPRN